MSERGIWCARALLHDGWQSSVRLRLSPSGMIVSTRQEKAQAGDIELHGVTLPGMPNAHSHGFQRLMTGRTGQYREGEDSFWGWRQSMYALARKMTPEQLGDCTAYVYAEMLAAGYTSCAEFHYVHHQENGQPYEKRAEMSLRVLEAAKDAGMPVTLLPVLYQVSGFGSEEAEPQQRRFVHTLDEYLGLLEDCAAAVHDEPLLRLGVAPHSLRAVPVKAIRALADSLPDTDTPVHIHVAEQPAEVEACLQAHGARPVEWLLDQVSVDPNWCLVHATHMNDDECEKAARSGAVVGLCPTTEADLGDGFFETQAWLDAGGALAIGSDSNLRLSVSEELRMLEFSARLRSGRRQVLRSPDQPCGRYLYERAARGGARALGQPVGELASDRRADLVELDADHPLLAGRSGDECMESFVFGGERGMIRSVFVAGKQVVREGHHCHEAALQSRYSSVNRALHQS